MSDAVDVIVPWTIKAISKTARDKATDAARKEGLTVGQWTERLILEWEGAGSPVVVSNPSAATPVNLGELAQLIEATRSLADTAAVALPPGFVKDAIAVTRQTLRQARGLSPPARRKRPVQAAIEGSGAGER